MTLSNEQVSGAENFIGSIPAAVRENEPALIPPKERGDQDRTRETAEIEPKNFEDCQLK